jgi:hypothetical protein
MRLTSAGAGSVRRGIPPRRWLPALCACAAILGLADAAAAQSVAGRVIDVATGQGIAGVRITMIRADGARMTEAISAEDGAFRIGATRSGLHRLEARHVAYATVTTENFRLEAEQLLVVDVRMGAVIPLDPLVVTGQRRDLRHEATHEGFYSRHAALPPIGNRRAVGRNDPEMINAADAIEVLRWLRIDTGTRGRSFCTVYYYNGHLMDGGMSEGFLAMPQAFLEGVEYYRYMEDAPGFMRNYPTGLMECARYSVVALWSRTGYFPELPPDTTPSSRRIAIASAAYHLAGAEAPGIGHGVEGTAHWPLGRRTAVGLTLRRTQHTLDAAATNALTPPLIAPFYVTPPGPRPLTLLSGSAEVRTLLQPRGRVWPVVAGRVIAARRTLTLVSSSENGAPAHLTSRGYGLGATVGGEVMLGGRFAAHLALGHDRVFFGPYSEIEHRTNRTSAHWGGTSLRIGAGFALER